MMQMNRTNQILAGLLLIQAIIALVIFFPRSEDVVSAGALLPDYNTADVSALTISTDADQQIKLAQHAAGDWMLPDYDEFPVDATRVTTLLDKLGALQANRIITRSETSHRRLQVAADAFVRRIEFQHNGNSHTLYLGNSGGGNAVHVRLDDAKEVYLVGGLSSNDANGQLSNWINTTYFNTPVNNVVEITLENANGSFEFSKVDNVWVLEGLAEDETFAADQFSSFLNQITNIRMSEPLSRTPADEWNMGTPQATLTIKTQETLEIPTEPDLEATAEPEPEVEIIEQVFTFQWGADLENGTVLKSSDSEFYVLISQLTAESVLTKTRDDFLVSPPEPEAE